MVRGPYEIEVNGTDDIKVRSAIDIEVIVINNDIDSAIVNNYIETTMVNYAVDVNPGFLMILKLLYEGVLMTLKLL